MLRISPLPSKRVEKLRISVMDSNGNFIGESRPHIVYSHSPMPVLRLAKRVGGTGYMTRTRGSSRWIRFEIGETVYFPGTICNDIEQLIAFRDYCHEAQIQARSIQGMAFMVMRQTLAGYFDIETGDDIPFDKFPAGPRLHAQLGVFSNVYQADISAAYLWGIGRFSPAHSFSRHRRIHPVEVAENQGSWALSAFRLNRVGRFGPIPTLRDDGTTAFTTRLNIWSNFHLLSSDDIRLALKFGADIKMKRAWIANAQVVEPFRDFMHLISRWRDTSPFPKVAKQAGNTLWGNFCASPRMSIVEFRPGKVSRIYRVPERMPLCRPVGYSVLAKLRARLYEDANHSSVIHAHTDGFMTTSVNAFQAIPHPSLLPTKAAPGEWRSAGFYREVELLNPSWYRTVDADGVEEFKLAGRPEKGEKAAQMFRAHRARMLQSTGGYYREYSD